MIPSRGGQSARHQDQWTPAVIDQPGMRSGTRWREIPHPCVLGAGSDEIGEAVQNEHLCDEFPGRRGSHFVIPVASDRTVDSARAGALESGEER